MVFYRAFMGRQAATGAKECYDGVAQRLAAVISRRAASIRGLPDRPELIDAEFFLGD
jgi:hypothetical protein